MRNRTWIFLALYGFFLITVVSAALKNTRPKFKIATTWTTPSSTTDKLNSQAENETVESENDDGSKIETTTVTGDLNATTGHTLTGIPQIDYIWDPNLPRELNGFNLSDYPFYSRIPVEEIDFKCDGLHDGFYASVPHKCQVYHHCLYGTRYDFLCANFTAFDQKTFICHFVSEVDCANSKKYWHRNDALYKTTTTTTIAPPTTTTTVRTTTTSQAPPQPFPQGPRSVSRRRRPFRRRPAYDYYDSEYYDDDYDRPRSRGSGYDRREEYDYDDRQYSRRDNRDRDQYRDHLRDHERDFRDKDQTKPREYTSERSVIKDDQDTVVMRPRDRFPIRNQNRRDPLRQEQGDNERGIDGRNYQDQRYDRGFVRDDYEDPEPLTPSNEGLVKPSAPISSVFARPRAPPKIRRPVPLSEQERFSYKATTPQSIAEESHRRPTEVSPTREQEYYDDQLEDIRPRRPLRRRPYRERERFTYDHPPRDMRDRPYRTRFRDEEEEMRPRKYPERPRDRDRYYERNRDRALLDHEKESMPERIIPEREREHRPPLRRPSNREKENDRPLAQLPNIRDITDESEDVLNKAINPISKDTDFSTSKTIQNNNHSTDNHNDDNKKVKNNEKDIKNHGIEEEYSSIDEYYDESEYSSSPSSPSSSTPPKTAVRIIKRPFLPSRGGNPNPRGLSTVGIKAPESNKKHITSIKSDGKIIDSNKEHSRASDKGTDNYSHRHQEPKVYDAYKAIENDKHYKKQDFDQQLRRPESSSINKESDVNMRGSDVWRMHEDKSEIKPSIPWNGEELRRRPTPVLPNRGNNRHTGMDNSSYTNYQPSYVNEQNRKEITGSNSPITKQKINEVPHRLLDIPESEYDVTLNEALTPAFNQDSNLPSGFVLPYNQHNRHHNREPVLEPSENNYRVSRPYNTQQDQSQQHHHHHHQQQQQQQQHQKSFVPSTQFFPTTRVAGNDERGSIQYFKTPEVVHIAGSGYNRQSGRNSWHDYTGYQ